MIFRQFFNHQNMKFRFLILLVCLPISQAFAQDITDAVRFSRQDLMGTARYTGMAGAFSSLGGDLSALKLNPAGSSIFLTNHASGTLNLNIKDNDVNFTDGFSSNNETTFDLNQAGIVFVFDSNNEEATLSKYAYGFTYEQIANYDDSYVARGNNNQSIDQFFLDSANGVPLDLLTPLAGESISDLYIFLGETEGVSVQNALLGFQSFVIDPEDPDDFNNTNYISNVTANSFLQDYFIQEDGYNGKFSFNASVELNKRFYFGLNLNAHYMEYERFTSYFESNTDPTSEINSIRFDNRLRTRANAFSFQLGSIVKITDQLRAALTYDSPTWYNVSDETTQFIRTTSLEFGPASVDPNVLNIFPDYNYRTASQWRAGLSYIFKGKGLLSFDYNIQDYSNDRFTSNSLEFLNAGIEQNLTSAANINVGGEYVFKQFKFRGGYFLQETPYEDEFIQGDLEGFSLGLGYTIKNVNFDLAYSLASIDRNDRLFDTGLDQSAQIASDITNLFLTVSFGF